MTDLAGCLPGGTGYERSVPVEAATRPIAPAASRCRRSVARRNPHPRGGFAALVGIYAAGVTGASVFAKRRGLPDRVSPWDLVLIGVATHKLSRRLTKDSVTSPFAHRSPSSGSPRAPVVNEEVKGRGLKKAIGELVTCPFCIGQWVATALVFGLVFAPRHPAWFTSVFASAAIADFLQLGYARAEQAADEG